MKSSMDPVGSASLRSAETSATRAGNLTAVPLHTVDDDPSGSHRRPAPSAWANWRRRMSALVVVQTTGSCRHPSTVHNLQLPSRKRTMAPGCLGSTTGPPQSAGIRSGRSREGRGLSGSETRTTQERCNCKIS